MNDFIESSILMGGTLEVARAYSWSYAQESLLVALSVAHARKGPGTLYIVCLLYNISILKAIGK